MRALLVVNPRATATTAQITERVTAQVASAIHLDTFVTTAPGAARAHLAAAGASFDAVITLGGDGTANEVAGALLDCGIHAALAPLPGGHANVLARNLGLPREPVAAAGQVAAALLEGRTRTLGLGRVRAPGIDRWFLTNAGLGPDAAVLARMQRRRARGRRASDLAYLALAAAELARTARSTTHVALQPAGVTAQFVLVANLSPWTYLGARPVDPQPRALADQALSAYAPSSATLGSMSRLVATMLAGGDLAGLPGVWTGTDLARIELASDTPLWLQADGEVLGLATHVGIEYVHDALTAVFGRC